MRKFHTVLLQIENVKFHGIFWWIETNFNFIFFRIRFFGAYPRHGTPVQSILKPTCQSLRDAKLDTHTIWSSFVAPEVSVGPIVNTMLDPHTIWWPTFDKPEMTGNSMGPTDWPNRKWFMFDPEVLPRSNVTRQGYRHQCIGFRHTCY